MKISDLTIEEKLHLLTAKDLWHTCDFEGKLPTVTVSDGPNGLRKMRKNANGYWEDIPSVAYPNVLNVASSWDRALAHRMSSLIAEDCIENGVDVLLGPGVNMKRTPLCGRNFEYFSEDPYLAGTMASAYIRGLEDNHVGTALKHFACNNREVRRACQSSDVGERALHETYTEAFRIATKAKPMTVMNSYNPVNGVYASQNKPLLDILRKDYGYDGLIISDWMGVHNSAEALKAGTNLRFPFDNNAYDELKTAYEKGEITEKEIDFACDKILSFIEKAEENRKQAKVTLSKEERRKIATELGADTIVLLKNKENVLPFKKGTKVAVIGENNGRPYISGGGSAKVLCEYAQKPLSDWLNEKGMVATASRQQFIDTMNPSNNLKEIVTLAEDADVSLVVVGESDLVESEGYDRRSIRLSEAFETLIRYTAKHSKKTVVVLEAGSAIDVTPFEAPLNEKGVDGIVFAGYLGDTCNEALSVILSGEKSPSAKLTETFPKALEDTYCKLEAGDGDSEPYDDGIYIGYRYYDKENISVQYPFGYGLSYAKFKYDNLSVTYEGENLKVTFDITNESDIDGAEISQLYVKIFSKEAEHEEKALKGFSKDFIPAHTTKRVVITTDDALRRYYKEEIHQFAQYKGPVELLVGASSRDIRLKALVEEKKE